MGRLYAALSVRTGIAPSVLLQESDEMIMTMLELIEEAEGNGG